jgi:response regulator of citrate/malate metabolism
MKKLNEYKTVGEVLQDAVDQGFVRKARAFRFDEASQQFKAVRAAQTLEQFKVAILGYVTERHGITNVTGWRMGVALRSGNHPTEYRAALEDLIQTKQITEELQVAGKRGRPARFYRLFEN